jgi:hypothetical protein
VSYPPGVYVVDGVNLPTIASAYQACTGGASPATTCEIWAYNLQNSSTNTLGASPWTFDGTEIPVRLHLGTGVPLLNGPLTVPRLSTISGIGRASGGTNGGNGGTVIRVSGQATFGGISSVSETGGSCPVNAVVTITGGTSSATAKVTTGGSSPVFLLTNMGGGFTASTTPVASAPLCTGSPTFSFGFTTTAVFIGDSEQISGSTQGSRLAGVYS